MKATIRHLAWILASTGALASTAAAQDAAPAYAIQGGKIYTLAGPPIEVGTVLIQDGRIAAVGPNVSVPAGVEVIDAQGLQVYPGLFDAVSRLGLTEIGRVTVTQDSREMGDYNPQLVAATAVHPASEHIPVTRANGVTHAVAAPDGGSGGLAGQASLIHLAGWTVEEMLVEPSVGMVLIWPRIETRFRDPVTRRREERTYREAKELSEERLESLEGWLHGARHYAQALATGSEATVERDLKLEALARVVRGELPFLIVANGERDIRNAVAFAERHELEFILAGGREAWKLKDQLAEKRVPVILGATQTLPSGEDEAYDEAFTNPGELHAAGVKIAFATFNSSSSRTLPYEAATAVPYGLPWEEALRAVTVNAAEIFGVDDRLGTVEPGKIANLIVTDGDPLAIQTEVRYLFIDGRLTSTDNKHRSLYERYRARK